MFQRYILFRSDNSTVGIQKRIKGLQPLLISFIVLWCSFFCLHFLSHNSHAALNTGTDSSIEYNRTDDNAYKESNAEAESEEEWEDEEWEDDFEEDQVVTIADPLEPLNRAIFNFNDRLYFWLIKPVAKVYQKVLPEQARISISNFYDNVRAPIRFINCTLQGKVGPAATVLSRFMLNTTVGVLGLFDPAEKWLALRPQKEDMGQTLGWYGLGHGFYLVLPFFGPSSLRDGVGFVGDLFLDPINYIGDLKWYAGVRAEEIVNDASLHMGVYEDIKRESLDPYLFIRNAYVQRRAKLVKE